MRFPSIRTASLLAILTVTSGLWAYQTNFTADPTDPLYPRTANSQGSKQSPACHPVRSRASMLTLGMTR